MFIRFAVSCEHEDSHRPMGVFHAAYGLRDRGRLDAADEATYSWVVGWFDGRLPIPTRFSRSRRRPTAHPNALCWFKSGATEHIRRVRQLVAVLERNAVPVRMLRTSKPGYIVYEDAYQVAAVPFRDTAT